MRILFVSSESPLFPAGGIATYLQFIVPALKALGHHVYLFTPRDIEDYVYPDDFFPFEPEEVHIELYDVLNVHKLYPSSSHYQSLSFYLASRIEDFIKINGIDVVEATDYQAPCLALFQNLQTREGAEACLFSTFHHGLGEVIFEADQMSYPDWSINNNLAERQQIRYSDIVIVPSHASLLRLKSLDIQTKSALVREPFAISENLKLVNPIINEIQYTGRLSIQKGMDALVYATNVLHSVFPLHKIELMGRVGSTSFRETNIINYIKSRLVPDLQERLFYSDYKARDIAIDFLKKSAISPHLGTDETFSYACVESISAGQLPIVRHGTAMAEFYPDDLKEYVLDSKMMSVHGLQKKFENILSNASRIIEGVREHCAITLNPEVIASQIAGVYEEALDRKRGWRNHSLPRISASVNDITVLIPAYKPDQKFMDTIDSIASQTIGVVQVLICDDGTPDNERDWFNYALARLPKCRIIRQPNGGLLAARNTLIEHCDTSLAIFLDADDLFAPELLERLLEAWNHCLFLPDAVIPQRRNFGESDELVTRNLLGDHMHYLQNDFRMTALIRTEVIAQIGFDSTRRNGEADDWVFWLEFEGRGFKGIMLPDAGFLYRFHFGSMSWPWSEGQNVGTQTMKREVIQDICKINPDKVIPLARAFYTQAVCK